MAGLVQGDVWVRIIHDAIALRDARRDVIVRKPKRVSGLMRAELANTRQYHGEHGIVRGCAAVFVGAQECFGDQVILPAPKRA